MKASFTNVESLKSFALLQDFARQRNSPSRAMYARGSLVKRMGKHAPDEALLSIPATKCKQAARQDNFAKPPNSEAT